MLTNGASLTTGKVGLEMKRSKCKFFRLPAQHKSYGVILASPLALVSIFETMA